LAASPASVTVSPGGTATLVLTSSANASFAGPLSLSLTGLPAGMTGAFSPSAISSSGSGSSTLTLSAASNVAPGVYSPVITTSGGGIVHTLAPTVNVPGMTLSTSLSAATLAPGAKAAVTATVQTLGGFNSAVAFSLSGLPSGVTGSLSPGNLAAPGSGKSTLTLSAPASTLPGTYPLTIGANGGGLTRTAPLSLNVPGFILTTNVGTISLAPKAHGALNVTPHLVAGFNSAIALSLSGLPAGVTYTFSPQTLAAPGSGASTLTITRSGGSIGTTQVTLKATGGGSTQSVQVTLNLTAN
jgi:uncharacterized membrane protein